MATTEICNFHLRGQLCWRREGGAEVLELYQPDEVEVVLGRCSIAAAEVYLDEVRASGIRMSRRRGGGCAVVIGPGMLLISYVRYGYRPTYPVDWGYRISKSIASCLQRLGVKEISVQREGDICIGDRKILGCCIYVGKEIAEYGASLLVDPEPSVFARYLRHPPREPEYRRHRPHEEFLTTLAANGYRHPVTHLATHLGPLLWAELHNTGRPDPWCGRPTDQASGTTAPAACHCGHASGDS